MAEIRPFRAWRYNRELAPKIDSLTSPLFDVVSPRQREALYQTPYNSINISVPRGEQPAQHAKELLADWKEKGVIVQDDLPAIYVYYQYFSLAGSTKEYCRKGFVVMIKAYDWPEKVILRHENTIPHAVNDRIDLLKATEMHASPTHGLYSDDSFELERYMDESMRHPIYESEDYQGVRDVLSIIHDAKVIKRFVEKLERKQVILADGHHRYESSLIYRKEMMAKNPDHTGEESYNYHMMYLTNMESDDLRILSTHRLLQNLENFSEEAFMKAVEPYFIIKNINNPSDIHEIILGKKWAFGLLFKENTYKIRLKPEVFDQLNWNFPEVVKELDLTVLHYFVLEKALGIPGHKQRASRNIIFERNFSECLRSVLGGESQCAIITQDISMEEVKKVCFSGYTMPQKSTYFYPKVISGFIYGSIKPEEFVPKAHSLF
ncbi:DUF1015 domain-containing protein [Roseivirga sp. BDSF3-8]|uniref:DUF1015 domain-containing protein n=1 Tax=Roseivirga sp. BDSF3-8 TaxID=3241598 RepID=UPI003531D53E